MSGDSSVLEEFKWAIDNGDIDKVKSIVNENQAMASVRFKHGRTPLHCAADYGQCDIVSYLVSQGADVHSKDDHGITPLLAAIYESHKECVELLLAKGACKTGKANSGMTYYECAETDDIKALLQ